MTCPPLVSVKEENPQEYGQGEDTGTPPILSPPNDEHIGDPGAPEEEPSEKEEQEQESDKEDIASIAESMSTMRFATLHYDISGRFPFVFYVYV
jgi:hypothetical protein